MPDILPHHIVTLNLKYGGTARPYKVLAFAQLAAKVLYLTGEPQSPESLARLTADVLGVSQISTDLIRTGLAHLSATGMVKEDRELWDLTDATRDDVRRGVEANAGLLDGILSRHFPGSIP